MLWSRLWRISSFRLAGTHLDRVIGSCARHGAQVGCSTHVWMPAASADMLVKESHRSTLEEFADWALWSDRVVTFEPQETPIRPASCDDARGSWW
jgi:hypothetical protein